jgi:short-subunit dehydrogenase
MGARIDLPPPLAFITGASSGIGQALAARCARAGWRLALVARREAALREWAQAQGLDGDRCGIYVADVADPESIHAAASACLATQGLPQVVIANAGISVGVDSAERADLAVMQEIFATHNLGMAATFQPFIAPMRERGSGTLVGVASAAAIRGLPGHAAYCASKAAVVAYCESLRVECRPHGLRVVTLLPGFVATPLTAGNPYPMPFLLTPEQVAQRAWRAIEAGASYRVIPWQMALAAKALRLLPNACFDRLFAGRARKPRRSGDAPPRT